MFRISIEYSILDCLCGSDSILNQLKLESQRHGTTRIGRHAVASAPLPVKTPCPRRFNPLELLFRLFYRHALIREVGLFLESQHRDPF